MTFPVMFIMVGIFQLFSGFWEYKCPRSVTGFKTSRSIVIQFIISGFALSEFFIFGTFYSSYLLATAFLIATISFLSYFVKSVYFRLKYKSDVNFNKNTTDVLFYLNLKVRQFCSSDQPSNTFFYKRDGLIVFFGEPDTTFNSMDKSTLQFFRDSLTQSTMGHVKFGGFIVIKDNDDYISLSSDEFAMLDVSVTDISQDHLKLVHMARI